MGNLPAISPPTHPPNFLEESLRALFARALGFKRMSFRQKINGPMCFVEFEDVGLATEAMRALYGHNLVSWLFLRPHPPGAIGASRAGWMYEYH